MSILNRNQFWLAVKFAVFMLMTWIIVSRIFFNNDFQLQWSYFLLHLHSEKYMLLLIAMLLMPVNWLLETLKWRLLLNKNSSFLNLLKSVLAGVTLGFVTPARSGEFVGRVMYLNDNDKTKIFYLSSIGGMAQTTATLMAGTFFLMQWSVDTFTWGLCFGAAVSFLFFYFRFNLLNRMLWKVPFLQKNSLVIENENLPSANLSWQVLLVSLIRYGVYIVQYVFMFSFFGVEQNGSTLLVYSGVWLVLQTVSPLMPLFDVSYRGATALFVFGKLGVNSIAIVTATSAVWLLNLCLPAVVGYLFILRKRM